MRVCFIGIGSIAIRHIKNLAILSQNEQFEVTIDCIRRDKTSSMPTDIANIVNDVYDESEEITHKYDIIFITNPTHLHLVTLNKYFNNTDNFFIEKPVFTAPLSQKEYDDYCSIADKIKKNGKKVYVACPLRYNAVVRYIKNEIDINSIISVRALCSSYLPDWRPGTDYTKNYSAHKEMGGGVKCDLIHEWDYLQFLFGVPDKINVISGKKSKLEIDSEDLAIYIAENEEMTIELHLDYFGRASRREIEIFMEDDTVIADLIHGTVRYLNKGKEIAFETERDIQQQSELMHAIDIFEGRVKNDNDLGIAIDTLLLTEGKVRL